MNDAILGPSIELGVADNTACTISCGDENGFDFFRQERYYR